MRPRVTHPEIRDTLFGDLSMDWWPQETNGVENAEPWRSFIAARDAVAAGRTDEAVRLWRQITSQPGLESRHYAQAWHFLRSQGVQPSPAEGKRLLGVILEVAMPDGVDLLAAYPEGTARYYNFSGAGVVWERPNDSLDPAIRRLLDAGQRVLNAIGPWDKPRLPAPQGDTIRLNFLAPSGLHFGQGPFGMLSQDAMARPVIDAGTALMQALVNLKPQR